MNNDTTVVFFTLFRTDNPYSSISLSMARELAKTNSVIYINHPYSWKDVVAGWVKGDKSLQKRTKDLLLYRNGYEHLDSIPERFIAVTPPPTLPINWLPPGNLHQFFQGINNRIVLRSIQKALIRGAVKDYIYINCYDPFFAGALPPEMGALLSIYHCVDDISQNPYTARHGVRLEQEAIEKADLTLVTSTNLYALKKSYTDRIVTCFNAADVAVFSQVISAVFPRPGILNGRAGPVIGFIGNLDELRIDYALLKKTALAHPDKTLLLVGPVNSPEPVAIGLDQLPNVLFAGSRSLQELPPLLQYMDVAIIPFLKNTLTKSIYPLKINEYLAAGKPVVATGFSDDIRTFSNCAYIADTDAAFVDLIGTAIAENTPEKVDARTKVAASNTWEVRIKTFKEWIIKRPHSPHINNG
jgi:teichuronic acid biosynthesis glycosyltransferase TuaH